MPICYIPIEISVRELKSRILLAKELRKRGFEVLLAKQKILHDNMHVLPAGIIFEKSISINKQKRLKKFIKYGHLIACQDEEALCVYNNPEIYNAQRVTEKALELVAKYYCWDSYEYSYLSKRFPNHNSKLEDLGSLREELWSKRELNTIEYAEPFVLLVSSFHENHVNGPNFVYEQSEHLSLFNSEAAKRNFSDLLESRKADYSEFVSLITELSVAFPEKKFVIRPHPSESIEKWKTVVSDFGNVSVIFENELLDWIAASEVTIHCSCTTGVEAGLIQHPLISFVPNPMFTFSKHKGNNYGIKLNSIEQVIAQLNNGVPSVPNEDCILKQKPSKLISESLEALADKLMITKFSLNTIKFAKILLNGKIKRVEQYEKYKCTSKDIERELQTQNINYHYYYSKIGLFKI